MEYLLRPVSLLFVLLLAFASPAFSQTPVKVLAQVPEWISDGQTYRTIGTAEARRSANLYPEVQERVISVHFEAGERVQKNSLLVQLENREEKLALQLANVELKNAKSLLRRFEQAVQQGAVPQTQVDEAQAAVEAALVAVERANLALADRQVRAPFTGIVGIPGVDKGQRVGPDHLVTGIDSREVIEVDIELPETLMAYLTPDATFLATSPALPGQQFTAQLVAQQNRLSTENRTLRVRTEIANPDDLIRPGMSFQFDWVIAGQHRPALPEIALQWSRDGSYVWAVRSGKAEQVPVRVVARKQGLVLLDGELGKTDAVIVEGVQRVRQGAPVQTLKNLTPERS